MFFAEYEPIKENSSIFILPCSILQPNMVRICLGSTFLPQVHLFSSDKYCYFLNCHIFSLHFSVMCLHIFCDIVILSAKEYRTYIWRYSRVQQQRSEQPLQHHHFKSNDSHKLYHPNLCRRQAQERHWQNNRLSAFIQSNINAIASKGYTYCTLFQNR